MSILTSSFFRACLTAGAIAQTPTPTPTPDPRYTIENCVKKFDATKAEETKAGSQFWFIPRDFAGGNTLKLSIVRPGQQTHPPHRHAEDEMFFILEGSGEFYLDGK